MWTQRGQMNVVLFWLVCWACTAGTRDFCSALVALHIVGPVITIYAPMIYTAPCIMFWMRAYPLLGYVGGGWALEFESFLGPVKWHRADRRVRIWGPKNSTPQPPRAPF